ncbi:MAG: ribosome small subunit-dependent GTPase A [Defluviitaleaceae bacterium]|nr:ribosome small subunit-dependent GTPase A [Defluviitaleaceae bacterium]
MLNGRIIKGVGGLYAVDTADGLYNCRVRGIFRKHEINPTVGDNVVISITHEGDREGVIDKILDRHSFLFRPRVANIDQAILVFSAVTPDINIDLMDRFILACEIAGVEIIICINKADIINFADFAWIKEIYERVGYTVIFTSAEDGTGLEEVKANLLGQVSVFAGPSGAGKSSLTNAIIPHANMQTGELSEKISRGRHTTRHTELIKAFENSYIVDSPGFSSLILENLQKDDLHKYFREFEEFSSNCKFMDCKHINEPICGVKDALGSGLIAKQRYNRYVNFYNKGVL